MGKSRKRKGGSSSSSPKNIDIYEGNLVDGKREGHGIMKFKNGDVYDGQWKNDKENGKGTIKYANGHTYTGDWEHGERVGKGKMKFKSGNSCEGVWTNDKMNGQGIYKFAKGDVYKGQFKDNEFHGQGKMEYANGRIYEGNWENGNLHGHGKMNFNNGGIYEGNWKNSEINGQGKMTFDDGDVYEGEWIDGKINGQGKMEYDYGDVYEGNWENGNKNGKGKMEYVNGNVYEGNWEKGIRVGQGKMKYKNGDIYVGEWKNNKLNGKGKMTYSDGTIYEGEWKDDNRQISIHLQSIHNNSSRSKKDKSRKSLSPKTKNASRKIFSFLRSTRSRIPERVSRYLNSVCSDSGECIMFGKEIKKIKKFFGNFNTFEFFNKIKRIGAVSANGFVNELEYEREGYKSYAVLKSSRDNNSDNLFYEAFVGVFINKLCLKYPCFMETYSSNIYNEDAILYEILSSNKNIVNIKSNDLKQGLKYCLSDCNNYKQFLIDDNIHYSCLNSTSFSVLNQHIKNAKSLKDLINEEKMNPSFYSYDLIVILYQVYSVLGGISNNFTHYDLHTGNVLLYTPLHGKFVKMNYHYSDGTIVSFNTYYISKIIDYGRSFFDDSNEGISSLLLKTKIKGIKQNINPDESGYGWLITTGEHHIDSSKKNISHDLRLLRMIKNNISNYEDDDITKKFFVLFKNLKYDGQYGTEEVLTNSKLYVKNVVDAHYQLKNLVIDNLLQMKSNNPTTFPDEDLLGTMDIYLDGSSKPMTYRTNKLYENPSNNATVIMQTAEPPLLKLQPKPIPSRV